MKILLTGANGLLGSYILRDLLEKKYEVRATKRTNSDLSLIDDIAHKVEWIEGDMTDYSAMEIAAEGCDVIIHSAAVVSYDPKDKVNMIKINVNGTKNLVDIALDKKLKKYIQISSIAAVGRPKTQFHLNEETKWEESPNNSTYAKSKYLSELEVWRGIAEGLDALILNPAFILGPGDLNKSSTQLFKLVLDKSKFYSDGNLNFVDVRDVATSAIKALESSKKGERFIICGGTAKFKDLFEKIASRWNIKAPSIELKPWLLEIIWRLEAIRSFIFGNKPIVSKDSVNSATSKYVLDNSKSKAELGMHYHSLNETLDWVCAEIKP